MDYKKDTTEEQDLSKGHNLEVSSNELKKQGDFISPLFKRTQKLITALYMVTDCLEDGEPMKFRLRTLGVTLLRDILSLRSDRALEKTFRFETLQSVLDETIALVEIAGTIGLISGMNSAILSKEFTALKTSIEEQKNTNIEHHFQSSLFGETPAQAVVFPKNYFTEETDATYQSNSKGQSTSSSVLYKNKESLKGQEKSGTAGITQNKSIGNNSDVAFKINRRNNILRLIKDKKEVTIKDVCSIITDCSEKTIQRELLALVAEGVLKKKGDKRWSKYSFF